MKRAIVSVFFGALMASLVACDDNKEEDLLKKVLVDSGPPDTGIALAPSTYDAAPPPKKQIVCTNGPEVDFHGDAVLEAEVRRKLGKDAGTITKNDLKTIKSVNVSQAQIDSLDPCVWPLFTGVHDIFLGHGDYEDLSPLANLTQLVTLRASISHVADLKPLAKMTKLDRLDIGRTFVRDITPLSNLTALTELQLDDTQISDIGALSPLKLLEKVSIRNTAVVDLSPLKDHKKLRFLYIEGTPGLDTTVLSALQGSGLKIVAKGQM